MVVPIGYQKVSFFDAINANKRNSLFLLIFIFLIYMALIGVFSYATDAGILAPFIGIFVLLFYTAIMYFSGDKIILGISNAKKAEKKDYPFLFNTVEGLAIAAEIPTPEIYVIEEDAPNAFATGRDPKHASVAVTTGLLGVLDRQELEGVLAHEISHIANYDIRFMMFVIVFGAAIALISDMIIRTFLYGGGDGRGNRKSGGGKLALLAIALAVIAPLVALLIKFAISRQRELLADSNGARMTRYPQGLASALEKIGNAAMSVKSATAETAPLYFSNPLSGGFSAMFATHPPIPERIKKLKGMY